MFRLKDNQPLPVSSVLSIRYMLSYNRPELLLGDFESVEATSFWNHAMCYPCKIRSKCGYSIQSSPAPHWEAYLQELKDGEASLGLRRCQLPRALIFPTDCP